MKIVVDMDEVLCQFVEEILRRWNGRTGNNIRRSQINMWRMEDTLGPDSEGLLNDWMSEYSFYDRVQPIPGAIAGFNELIKAGHDVVIASAIPGDCANMYDGKRRWIKRHLPELPRKNFIAVSRKSFISGDVLIDDGSHNIVDWSKEGHARAIIMDAPWNQGEESALKVYPRASNWAEVISIIKFWNTLDEYQVLMREAAPKAILKTGSF